MKLEIHIDDKYGNRRELLKYLNIPGILDKITTETSADEQRGLYTAEKKVIEVITAENRGATSSVKFKITDYQKKSKVCEETYTVGQVIDAIVRDIPLSSPHIRN